MRMMIRTMLSLAVAGVLIQTGCQSSLPAEQTHLQTRSFALSAYEKYTLDNGLTIMLMPKRDVPLISVNALVRVGAVHDPVGGMAEIAAQSLMLGAAGESKQQIEQQVDFLGASLDVSADLEGSSVRADFMAKDCDTMLRLVSNVLQRPDFDAEEFAKLKARSIAGLELDKQSPKSVIRRYFSALFFGSHPYGNPVSGTQNSLERLTLSDVKAFYNRFYQPGNTTLCVVGDFEVDAMKTLLAQQFGGWEAREVGAPLDLKSGLAGAGLPRVLLVNKPDALETTFMVGGKGIARNNPDYVGVAVINTILGGRFTSWLNDELRVNSGLTYGAYSRFVPFCDSGVFLMSTFTQTESTEQALDLALETYQRLWTQGIDAATLASAKAYVKGQFPPRYQTCAQLAGLLADMALYGFDESYINDFQQQVDQLTEADCQRLIHQYFPRKSLQFVLIGNADIIAPVAEKYGTVIQTNITAAGFGR